MQKKKISNTIILTASPGHLIARKDDPDFPPATEVWLGVGESTDNYTEVEVTKNAK